MNKYNNFELDSRKQIRKLESEYNKVIEKIHKTEDKIETLK